MATVVVAGATGIVGVADGVVDAAITAGIGAEVTEAVAVVEAVDVEILLPPPPPLLLLTEARGC